MLVNSIAKKYSGSVVLKYLSLDFNQEEIVGLSNVYFPNHPSASSQSIHIHTLF